MNDQASEFREGIKGGKSYRNSKSWIYEQTSRLTVAIQLMTAVIVTMILVVISWPSIVDESHKELFIINSDKFISVLRAQAEARYVIRIGCEPRAEESCVIAGRFVEFFREAGWIVEDNSVQRTMLGKPEAGILV